MSKSMRRLAAAAFAAICLGVVAAPAMAEDATAPDSSQLLDVSKQVSSIQRQMGDLLARGRWATAGRLVSSADCAYGASAQIFLPWGDEAQYMLAPQGNFSSTAGWTLNKQASVVSPGDPFTGTDQSLRFQNGAQAATPAMCVDLDDPTIRFFTRDVGGNGKAVLKVDVLYEAFDGHVRHLTIARVKAGSDWQPSVVLPMYMNMLAMASPDGTTAVAFQFKAEGLQKDETLSISSLFVDPFHSR
jgi:hypothetical protein